jgi:hypothetical protein
MCLAFGAWWPGFLENLGSEGYDLHEVLFAKFTGHRAEDTCSLGVVVFVDDDNGVVVETKNGTIRTANGVGRADDHSADDISFFYVAGWACLTDVSGDYITHTGGAGALSEDTDHFAAPSTGIIGDRNLGLHLDHNEKGIGCFR